METVLLGMSGGVDSTAAAALLKTRGYAVRGVFFVMHETHLSQTDAARRAAEDAGVPLEIRDLRKEFAAAVTRPFAAEYLAGRTPNPCVLCNAAVKFPFLLREAERLGADRIATGHYAAVREKDGTFFIARGADEKKDQSYFLYPLGQKILSRLLLPLSDMTKDGVRAYAASRGFAAATRRDSQDICFIPDGDSGAFVEKDTGSVPVPGEFCDTSGRILGTHRGIFRYTVGQRRGLGIASDAPLYVLSIRPAENRVILGREEDLYTRRVRVRDCVFAAGTAPDAPFDADVCIRYSKKCFPARLVPDEGGYTALFDTPQRAPAPGQSAVFYGGDLVLGGGIIR